MIRTHKIISCLLLIMIIAAVLRFHDIGKLSLWLDEGYSYWSSSQSLAAMWTIVPRSDCNPPLYFMLLKGWRVIVGDSEAALRSLSAIFSIATIPLVFLLGRIIGGAREGAWIGLGAATLFALSPLQLLYAQEVRTYALLTLTITLTLCGISWLMRYPEAACRPLLGLHNRRTGYDLDGDSDAAFAAWIALICGASLGLWTHGMSTFFMLSLLLITLVWFGWQLKWNPTFFVNGLLAGAMIVILWLPIFFFVTLVQTKIIANGIWIPTPTIEYVYEALNMIFGVHVKRLNPLLPLAGLAFAGLWIVGRRSGWQFSVLVGGLMVLPILLQIIASFAFRPVFLERYLTWVTVPYYVAIAAGVTLLRWPWARVALLTALALLFFKGSVNYYNTQTKEPWQRIVGIIAQQASPDDVVLLISNDIEVPYTYYARKQGLILPVFGLPAPFPALDMPNPYPIGVDSVPAMTPRDIPALRELIQASGTVWLITRGTKQVDPENLVLTTLRETRTQTFAQDYGPVMYRFE